MGKIILEKESYGIVGAAMQVWNTMGYGFLEKVYENALAHRLRKLGLEFARLMPQIRFVGTHFGKPDAAQHIRTPGTNMLAWNRTEFRRRPVILILDQLNVVERRLRKRTLVAELECRRISRSWCVGGFFRDCFIGQRR